MKIRQILFFTLIATALFLQACGGAIPQSVLETALAETLQIAQLQTAAAQGAQPTTAVVPSDTPAPSLPTLTATSSIPYTSVTTTTNCRSGPTQFYSLITQINVGQQVEVVAVYNASNYVVIRNPNGSGVCWLWLQYATTTNFSAYNLPVATQPPTPNPTNTPTATETQYIWDGSWTGYIDTDADGVPDLTCAMSFSRSGLNLTGSYDCGGGLNGTIIGTLSSNLRNASGGWSNSLGSSGNFDWQRKTNNTNQFVGNYDDSVIVGSWAWCGGRSGASEPSPCYGP